MVHGGAGREFIHFDGQAAAHAYEAAKNKAKTYKLIAIIASVASLIFVIVLMCVTLACNWVACFRPLVTWVIIPHALLFSKHAMA